MLPEGSAARRVFCGPLRANSRPLPPVRLDPVVKAVLRRREKRVVTSGPVERQWLRAARTARGLRLQDVADSVGLSLSNVWRLEQYLASHTTERRAVQLQALLGLSDAQRVALTTTLVTRWS